MRRTVGVCALTLITMLAGTGVARTEPVAPVAADPRIGVVFFGNTPYHTCSGTVLDTPTKDLVITAGHCVLGPGFGISFAPGYDDGASPHGDYNVAQIYQDPRWVQGKDPRFDYSVLRLDRPMGITGMRLATAPSAGTATRVTGYVQGIGGNAVSCTAPTGSDRGFPLFRARGSSTAPAVARGWRVSAIWSG